MSAKESERSKLVEYPLRFVGWLVVLGLAVLSLSEIQKYSGSSSNLLKKD